MKNFGSELTSSKKNVLLLGQSIIIIALLVVVFIQAMPKYTELVVGKDQESLDDIVSKLNEGSISYKIEDNIVLVKEDEITEGKMLLAGLDVASYSWTDVFASTSLEYTNSENTKAKEDILRKSIEDLDSIDKVTIDIQSDDENELISLLMTIYVLEDQTLSGDVLDAIELLLISSLKGLSSDRIFIVDKNGEALN